MDRTKIHVSKIIIVMVFVDETKDSFPFLNEINQFSKTGTRMLTKKMNMRIEM